MTTNEFSAALEQRPVTPLNSDSHVEETRPFFIFTLGDSKYALSPSAIQEIIPDLEIYPLPGCPPYVPGLINCHGTPFTVFDLRVLFEKQRQMAQQFLILKLDQDNVAFGCTEVNEIIDVPLSEISTFLEKNQDSEYCSGVFIYRGQRVLILEVESILKKLERDLV